MVYAPTLVSTTFSPNCPLIHSIPPSPPPPSPSFLQPPQSSSQMDPILRRVATVLDPLCKSMPKMLDALYHLAKLKFLCGMLVGEGREGWKESKKSEGWRTEVEGGIYRHILHSGEAEVAQAILHRILSTDSNSMEAHLLMSKIHLHRGNVKQCSISLEMALSSNFEVSHTTRVITPLIIILNL